MKKSLALLLALLLVVAIAVCACAKEPAGEPEETSAETTEAAATEAPEDEVVSPYPELEPDEFNKASADVTKRY